MVGTEIPRGLGRGILLVALSASSFVAARGELAAQATDPKALVAKVVEEAGGADALRNKTDVEYTYLYRRAGTGAIDVSLERYVFDGEKSWARYQVHESVHPSGPGPVVQGYDGQSTWQTVAGLRSGDEKSLAMADFLRKTNFYWFTMTFKLLDPGMRYTYEGKKKVGATTYELVKIGFDDGVGDVSDTYLLYIDPKTWRIDQFLFTVLDFGRKDPFLMKVEYERIDGVLLSTRRRYAPSDWSGKVPKDAQWTDEVSLGVRFDNGFEDTLFEAP
ncbi:MAG: DUF6503 family protein [Polyangiales bacterium]